MTEIRAFLFDMDGVIVDSNPLHRDSWAEYNRRQGVETTEAMQQRMYGKRNDMIVRDYLGQHLTEAEVTAHGAAKEKLYREMLAPRLAATLVTGLVAFLQRHQSMPMAVATNAERANVDFVSFARGRSGNSFASRWTANKSRTRSRTRMSICGPQNCWAFRPLTASFLKIRMEALRQAWPRVCGSSESQLPMRSFLAHPFWCKISTIRRWRDGSLKRDASPPRHFYKPAAALL